MGSLELDIDYVYFQPPHKTIMSISKLGVLDEKNAMKILIYDYIHMC